MYIEISVFLDGKSFYCEHPIDDTLTERTIMIGRKFEKANGQDSKPLVGLMETLAICSDDITLREFSRVAEKLDCISKSSKYDEFGLYKGLEISKSGASILSSEVDYFLLYAASFLSCLFANGNHFLFTNSRMLSFGVLSFFP